MAHATTRSRSAGTVHRTGRGATPGAPPQRALLVIAAAVIVALAVWALIRLVGVAPVAGRGGDLTAVTTGDVVVATVVASMGAWLVHTLLGRAGKATRWWPYVGSTALAVSITGPTWLADGASGVALICLHVAVGIVLIAGFARLGHGSARRAPAGVGPTAPVGDLHRR
ncbi:MAG TPA: DUF6069 family protein [Euzebyales bacterium]|nr:DUF6069 family protein [Euzebyales bacterium]